MRIVVAVDWSDQAFNAVQETCKLYTPTELTLVHAVDLGFLENPVMAQAMNLQGYDEFRNGMVDAGRQVLDRTSALVPSSIPAVKQVNEIGNPAKIILDAAKAAKADLLVVGSRNRNRATEMMLGSVSHRVLMHATCSTLIVKRQLASLRKVLLAIEGPDDAVRLREWLHTHPFNTAVELLVVSVVDIPYTGDPAVISSLDSWNEASMKLAESLASDMATSLNGTRYRATHKVVQGHPANIIGRESAGADLLVVGSHARKGVERFLLGSVSHALSHRATCPVLVIR